MKHLSILSLVSISALAAPVPHAISDAMRTPELRNVRLGGPISTKMQAFIHQRITSEFARKEVFGEARSAFEKRDDDEREIVPNRKLGGVWRGEFWGKQMISTARVADYLRDPTLLAFIREECQRMIALEDKDGYLGSYADKRNVAISEEDKQFTQKAYGWNTSWNLWNRKYCIWGMLMAYKATGDRSILASVERQMNQWIDMMHDLKLPLFKCGQPEKVGLPPMSVLKPLLMIYAETGNQKYLDYAGEIVKDWDRDDGACPNFLRNYSSAKPISTWYPGCTTWAKTYEMLSCLDGILEHYRVTGEKRDLDAVVAIRDNIFINESNALGGIGYCDQLHQAAKRMNAVSELCDAVHWIRLNLDLFLITGNKRYLDTIETCYFNNFLAGIWRDGTWTAFGLRSHLRHNHDRQCGYALNHCCVNNAARTWMDMASSEVTVDMKGVFHVNFYQDATVSIDGVRFDISGNYPVNNQVTVKVSGRPDDVKVEFRKPAWCPNMDVTFKDGNYTVVFNMNARIVNRDLAHDPDGDNESNWIRRRYGIRWPVPKDIDASFRHTPAASVMWGPLILARSRLIGATLADLNDDFTINLKGYSLKATPVAPTNTWGEWELEFTKPGATTRRMHACDYQSSADGPYSSGANIFSIWF